MLKVASLYTYTSRLYTSFRLVSLTLLDVVVFSKAVVAAHVKNVDAVGQLRIAESCCRTVSAAQVDHGSRRQTRCPSDAKS